MKSSILPVVLLAAIATTPALAADLPTRKAPPPAPVADSPWGDIVAANNQISVDFLGTDFNYWETGNGRLGTRTGELDSETSWTPGVEVSASIMRNFVVDDLYVYADVIWDTGRTHYTGARQGGVFGSVTGSDGASVVDTDFRIGKGFALAPAFMLTPYVGAGSNHWVREVNAGEDYSNGYIGAGVLAQFAPFSKFVVSANALVGATFDSRISVAGSAPFAGGLGDSAIFKLGLGADYAITSNIHVNAGVDYVNFRYGESAIYYPGGLGTWEPDSQTSNVTLKVGLGYAF